MTTRTRVVFLFYIKRTKLLRNGEAPIYLQIKVDKQTAELSIMKSINPDLWSIEKNGATGMTKEARDINNYLNFVRNQINEHLTAMRDEGMAITAQGLRNSYLGIKDEGISIIEKFQEHNDKVKILKGKDFAPATLQRYETCLRLTQQFIREKYKREDLPLERINHEFITSFEFFLKTVRNCSHNTAIKYIKNFKKVIRIALANGWIKKDPFANYKFTLKKVDKGFLSEEELDTIINMNCPSARLEHVRDCFVFGCFTGLAYSDLKSLNADNIVTGNDGKLWINAKRHKTNNQCNIPLLPKALEILNKYRTDPECIKRKILLPVLSNQKLNSYLKEIADKCEIKKEITTHMARHTFATTVTLNNDIPIESVSKMLGHSSINMTRIYARLLDKKVGQDMNKLFEKYSNT